MGESMRTGKLAEAVLLRSILRQLDTETADHADRYGADCAFLPHKGGCVSAYTAVSAVPGFAYRPGALAVAAANNLSAAGAQPEALMVHAVLPTDCSEAVLREDMRGLIRAAKAEGMQVLGGHTQVSSGVKRPMYHVTGIGCAAQQGECGSASDLAGVRLLRPGDALVMTKWIALAGTAALALSHADELGRRFPVSLLDHARAFEQLMSVTKEARAAGSFGSCAMHDLSQGGIFTALWEMANRAGVGLEVDLKKIPIRQETVELCEYFDINPYNLYSAGALLIGTAQPEGLIAALAEEGVPAAVIGRATDENGRVIRNGAEMRFLDRPQQDEWYRRFEE